MKYLKEYRIFKEDLEVELTDKPDEKYAKEEINDTIDHIAEFKQKKPIVDQLYGSTSNSIEIESSLKNSIPNLADNPFLVDYLKICRLTKEIDDGRKSDLENKLKLDEFGEQEKLSTNPGEKKTITDKISEIKDRMSIFSKEIPKKVTELQKLNTEHKDKMSEIEKNIKEDTQEIESKV